MKSSVAALIKIMGIFFLLTSCGASTQESHIFHGTTHSRNTSECHLYNLVIKVLAMFFFLQSWWIFGINEPTIIYLNMGSNRWVGRSPRRCRGGGQRITACRRGGGPCTTKSSREKSFLIVKESCNMYGAWTVDANVKIASVYVLVTMIQSWLRCIDGVVAALTMH